MGKWVKLVNNSNETIGLTMVSGFDRYHDSNFFERGQIGELGAAVSVPSYITNFENPAPLADLIFQGITSGLPPGAPGSPQRASWSSTFGVRPSISMESARSYFSEMSSMDAAVLRKPNTLQRMISVPYPAGFHLGRSSLLNVADAYKLHSMSFSVNPSFTVLTERPVVGYEIIRDEEYPIYADYTRITGTGTWSISFIASIISPGGELTFVRPSMDLSTLFFDQSRTSPLFGIQGFMTTAPTSWSYGNNNGPLSTDVSVLIPAANRPNINTYEASQILDDVYNQLNTIFGPF